LILGRFLFIFDQNAASWVKGLLEIY